MSETPVRTLLGIELPIIQAPMAGVQGSALAAAVSKAGGRVGCRRRCRACQHCAAN